MSRTPKVKELVGTRLASGHGGWVYCESCGENIGYLCYVTYDSFRFSYQCKCGAHGSMYLSFAEGVPAKESEQPLNPIKNRLCCPQDSSPLFTILSPKIDSFRYEVTCAKCGTRYRTEKAQ